MLQQHIEVEKRRNPYVVYRDRNTTEKQNKEKDYMNCPATCINDYIFHLAFKDSVEHFLS